ncbi:hypothetical protein BHM03_00026366 [Ensete ventricosum]|nr:hypothetical protein BHM03_00026366 [Ensete ventricosum]
MASPVDLPCDADGRCMVCEAVPPSPAEVVLCRTCATPWHAPCLSLPPETLAMAVNWECPDCSSPDGSGVVAAVPDADSALIASIRAIEVDQSLTEKEKAWRRQVLVGGRGWVLAETDNEEEKKGKKMGNDDVLGFLDAKFICSFCMQLPDRPVTVTHRMLCFASATATPCGHNFCLKCFQKWVGQGKHSCAKCRAPIPSKMACEPRINSALVVAIRMAKTALSTIPSDKRREYHSMCNENRPDKAFTTERAKKAGKANACSGQIFVTVPPDHFGPILAVHDPKRKKGVLVGEIWEDRLECRQWGAHLPHVAGIAGQSNQGAQSVALSGGYEDDEDHGDWFLYTGRSRKEKRSSYAPETGVRYDGIYRIEKCWRKVNRELMDLIELLQKRKHEVHAEESNAEISNLLDLSTEKENNDQEKRLRNYGSDLGENMVENESVALKGKKLKGKGFDIYEQPYKSVDGESETYAVNCEMDEIGETYCLGLKDKVVRCVTYKPGETNCMLNGIDKTLSLGLTNKVGHYVTYKRRKLTCEMDEIGMTSCLDLTNKVGHYVTYERRKLNCEMDEIGTTSCLGLTNKVVHYVTYNRRKTNCEMDKTDKTSCLGVTNKVVHYVTYKRRETNCEMDKIEKINCLGFTSKVVHYVTYKRRKTNQDRAGKNSLRKPSSDDTEENLE